MSRILLSSDAGFDAAYERLIAERGERLDQAESGAREIAQKVRAGGMQAVLELTAKFDGLVLKIDEMRVTPGEIQRAYEACPKDLIAALEEAADRIRSFHEKERPQNGSYVDAQGVKLGWRWTPVDAAGLYAPGGLAAYPSSVLMNAVPAKAAGVKRVAMATPPGKLFDNPAILAAAKVAGVDEIWKIGGAQAIAALAYGAAPLKATDIVVGPGNAFVAAAKKVVFGDVGVDSIAGPSEVFIISDGKIDPSWIAADLLAQAEHDADAQSLLFTTDRAFAEDVMRAVDSQIAAGQAGQSARASWERFGAIILVRSLEEACALANQGAAEHVQIAADNADALAQLVTHAGAIFLGAHAPEALGDYVAGPSHVLPVGRRARFSSGVTTQTFMKRTSLIAADANAVRAIGPAAARIADAEGLPAHAQSVRLRLEPKS
ncbi:MAG: histidinol dehydrogenase [Caulobacterales bacterium]